MAMEICKLEATKSQRPSQKMNYCPFAVFHPAQFSLLLPFGEKGWTQDRGIEEIINRYKQIGG